MSISLEKDKHRPLLADSEAQITSNVAPNLSRAQKVLILSLTFTATLGSFNFGYCMGVFNTMDKQVPGEFNWGSDTSTNKGLVVSFLNIGAVIGAVIAGKAVDFFGRRRTLQFNTLLFIVGGIIEFFANGLWLLVFGRLVSGVGVGVVSLAAPLYIAEIAPAHLRGALGSVPQLMVTIGILVSYLVGLPLPSSYDPAAGDNVWWRWMFLLAAIPAAVQLALFSFVFTFETPRWLLTNGRDTDAIAVLNKLVGYASVDTELIQLRKGMNRGENVSWKEVFHPRYRLSLIIGGGLAMLQQLMGINAVIFFSNDIFHSSGIENETLMTSIVGVVNVLMTVVAVFVMDIAGRRILLLIGTTGMCVFLIILGVVSFLPKSFAWISVVSVLLYIAFFAVSAGPIVWLLISEIYSSKVRGTAMSIATGLNWTMCILVSQFFLMIKDAIHDYGCFWLFAAFCVATFIFVMFLVPETKGRSLEEIEAILSKGL